MLGDVRKEDTKDMFTVMVDSSYVTVQTLFDLLRAGVTYNHKKDTLQKILDAAKALGINISSVSSYPQTSKNSFLLEEDSDYTYSACEEMEDTLLAFSESDNTMETGELFEDNFVTLSETVKTPSEQLSKQTNVKDLQGTFSCELCEKHFKSSVKLKIHSLFHSNFKCEKCNEGFRMPSLLQRHARQCAGEKKTNSNLKVFSSVASLKSLPGNKAECYRELRNSKAVKAGKSASCGRLPGTSYVSRSVLV